MLIYRFLYVMLIFVLCVCIGYAFAHNAKRYGVMVTPTEVKESCKDDHEAHKSVRSNAYARKYEYEMDNEYYVTGFGYGTATSKEFIDEDETERSIGSYWVKVNIYSRDIPGGGWDDECGTYEGELWKYKMDVETFESTGGVSRVTVESHGDVDNQEGAAYCDIDI